MQSLANIRIESPLSKRVVDERALKSLFAKFPVVPYAGTNAKSGHRELMTLWQLYDQTTSFAACTQDIANYSFGGDLEIIKKPIAGLKKPDEDEVNETEDVPFATQVSYAEALESVGVSLVDIIEMTEEQLFPSYQVSGTVFLKYKEVTVGGEKQLILRRIHETQALFLYDPVGDNPDNERTILVAPELNEKAIKDGRYELLKIYPFMDVEANGDRTTVFCLKNKQTAGDWWGRGRSQHVLPWMLSEYLQADLNCKASATDFLAKYIYLMEQPPAHTPRGGDDSVGEDLRQQAKVMRKTTTNKGTYNEAQGVGMFSYPNGVTQPKLDKLDVNRDSDNSKFVLSAASDEIYSINQWSKELSGRTQTAAGIGGNQLKDMFKIKNAGVIPKWQRKFERFWQVPLSMALEFAGSTEMGEVLNIKFEDKLATLIEAMGDAAEAVADEVDESAIKKEEVVL